MKKEIMPTNSNWSRFAKTYLGKVAKAVSAIMNILALIISIVSLVHEEPSLSWTWILIIVIVDSFYLVVVTIYETLIYKRGEHIHRDLKAQYDSLAEEKSKNDSLFTQTIDQIHYYYNEVVAGYRKYRGRLMQIAVDNYHDLYELMDLEKTVSIDVEALNLYYEKKRNDLQEIYREKMLHEFNAYLHSVVEPLKRIIEQILTLKGEHETITISIKLLQQSLLINECDDGRQEYNYPLEKAKILTVFRDDATFTEGEREIGSKIYSINGNTDFQMCLSNSYFLKNGICKEDKSYINESPLYYEKYNCAIVVPITDSSLNATELFGYLTCDTFSDRTCVDEIMDFQMAEVMIVTANIIGEFFKDMDFQWHTETDESINETIFSMKKEESKNRREVYQRPKSAVKETKKKQKKKKK